MNEGTFTATPMIPARINSTAWETPASTIQEAAVRVNQALAVLKGNGSDIWNTPVQIDRMEELGGDPALVAKLRLEVADVLEPSSI